MKLHASYTIRICIHYSHKYAFKLENCWWILSNNSTLGSTGMNSICYTYNLQKKTKIKRNGKLSMVIRYETTFICLHILVFIIESTQKSEHQHNWTTFQTWNGQGKITRHMAKKVYTLVWRGREGKNMWKIHTLRSNLKILIKTIAVWNIVFRVFHLIKKNLYMETPYTPRL